MIRIAPYSSTIRRGLAPIALFALWACASDTPTTPTGPSTFKSSPCSQAGTLQLAIATAARVDCSNGGTTVTLAGNGASYIVVAQFAVDLVPDTLVTYRVSSGTAVAASVSPAPIRFPSPRGLSPGLGASPMRTSQKAPGAAQRRFSSALHASARDVKPQALQELVKPTGALNFASIAQAIACAIPENAILIDESLTTGRGFFPPTAAAAPHDWLQNMGGSIGFSTPLSIGAAIACPDRKVICMVGDGSAMYTIQSLWTQAREGLDVVTIVFANRIYQILRGEFDGVGAGEPGQRALDMLKIDRPTIDFVALARGMGVAARAVTSADELNRALAEAIAEPGPRLIEVQM